MFNFLKKNLFSSDAFFCAIASYMIVYVLKERIGLSFFKTNFFIENHNIILFLLNLFFFLATLVINFLFKENSNA